ncbi:hypothetical protein BD410DRAFT_795484 [Rickenella mellea]|uniref:Uncharacterized protein n=1 Tax=Rickenella mellea TaxID=50990 RepID=A0A4Y7PMC3_9AGAM|nr:hypothetical protein BD410DRAFT_795484 [Rickenella mellea]
MLSFSDRVAAYWKCNAEAISTDASLEQPFSGHSLEYPRLNECPEDADKQAAINPSVFRPSALSTTSATWQLPRLVQERRLATDEHGRSVSEAVRGTPGRLLD